MGNQTPNAKLYDYIEKKNLEKIRLIVENNPGILSQDLHKDVKVTPLSRAVWRGDFEVTALLIQLGANANEGGSDGITPIMWAAKRDNAYMVSNLIDAGASIDAVSKDNFTALDYAIVHGNYRPALFLYDFFPHVKDSMDYYQHAKARDYRYVNYEMFLTHLKQKVSYLNIPNIFERPQKKKLLDPVIDPREPWSKMISRVVEFEDPPMVERSELPENLQPQNRFWGRMRSQLNGLDPEPKPHLQQFSKDEVQGLHGNKSDFPEPTKKNEPQPDIDGSMIQLEQEP